MNNLNDPDWNIRPDQGAGGGNSKWNYALLVPMLGLAAFRWIWSKESEKEIHEARTKYDKTMKAIQEDLELKYRQSLAEDRKETIQLEMELERERRRAQGFKQALASQSQQLLEKRQGLRRERQALDLEKGQVLESGAAGALFHEALGKEGQREQTAIQALRQVEEQLVERQSAFCSILVPREKRLEMEKDLLVMTAREPALARLGMEDSLRDIFTNDRRCAEYLNTDKRRNGSLMWVYLRYWQLQVTLEKHQRAEASLLATQPTEK
ncbi:coiled-coil domain-containing protein 127b [Clupea harengus]|uniref:Coiled-coil domain-containing protein 127b n=1 Tax=Clupea harengus TaxID=7950 RepID=A0A6P8GUR4_CLUHA|nr:coiled-coil domain-containing protein 127b [Clupea harengus]XP_031442279.1 coiled-coil domain-containing protein 127b [Clupea harengus]XP_031442280.1 coiled-coil domain-containing protein 127b [Clupea harengus]